MELENLRALMEELNFDEEYIINQNFHWKEGKGTIIALTRLEKKLSLWMLVDEHEIINKMNRNRLFTKKIKNGTLTEREQMICSVSKELFIQCVREVEIQGKNCKIKSMSGSPVTELAYDVFFSLLYFMKRGVNFGELEKNSCDSMELAQFVLYGEYDKIPFHKEQPAEVKIILSKRQREVFAGKKFTATIGDFKNKKISLLDNMTGKDYSCYINKVGLYDPWSEKEMKQFDTVEYKEKFTEKELGQMKQQYFSLMERTCPKGKTIVYVEYETEGDISVDFHTREFLKKKVVTSNAASVIGFFMKPEKLIGTHGLELRSCMLEMVEDNIEKIPIELLQFYINEEIGEIFWEEPENLSKMSK